MKKLFLTSITDKVLGKLTPLLNKSINETRVAFIPTAADPYENKSFVDQDRNKWVELGYNVEDVDIKKKNKEQLLTELDSFDIIYVAGGNTFYLLQHALESGFGEVVSTLLAKGKIYAGGSAGAIVVGPSLEPIQSLDHPEKAQGLTSFEALGIVDFIVLPHFDDEKYGAKCKQVLEEFKDSPYKFIPLQNNQAIVIEDDQMEIV